MPWDPQIDPPQTAFPPLANGLLLDIYCLIHSRVRDLGSSSITSRLAQTLYYLGCSPQPTSEIAKRWSKEATKLQDVFIRQRKTKYNKPFAAVYLAARPTFQPLQEQLDQGCATWLCLSLLVLIIVRLQALLAELNEIGSVQTCADSLVALSANQADSQVRNQPVSISLCDVHSFELVAHAQPNLREQIDKVPSDAHHKICTENKPLSPCEQVCTLIVNTSHLILYCECRSLCLSALHNPCQNLT
jgi:hypothetical protein